MNAGVAGSSGAEESRAARNDGLVILGQAGGGDGIPLVQSVRRAGKRVDACITAAGDWVDGGKAAWLDGVVCGRNDSDRRRDGRDRCSSYRRPEEGETEDRVKCERGHNSEVGRCLPVQTTRGWVSSALYLLNLTCEYIVESSFEGFSWHQKVPTLFEEARLRASLRILLAVGGTGGERGWHRRRAW